MLPGCKPIPNEILTIIASCAPSPIPCGADVALEEGKKND